MTWAGSGLILVFENLSCDCDTLRLEELASLRWHALRPVSGRVILWPRDILLVFRFELCEVFYLLSVYLAQVRFEQVRSFHFWRIVVFDTEGRLPQIGFDHIIHGHCILHAIQGAVWARIARYFSEFKTVVGTIISLVI